MAATGRPVYACMHVCMRAAPRARGERSSSWRARPHEMRARPHEMRARPHEMRAPPHACFRTGGVGRVVRTSADAFIAPARRMRDRPGEKVPLGAPTSERLLSVSRRCACMGVLCLRDKPIFLAGCAGSQIPDSRTRHTPWKSNNRAPNLIYTYMKWL